MTEQSVARSVRRARRCPRDVAASCTPFVGAASATVADDRPDSSSMTESGARQHLTALVDDGLVDARETPSGSAPSRSARP